MKQSQIREHLAKGWIQAIVTFEVVGKPAEHVEEALTGYLENIKQDHRIIFLREEREPAAELEDGLFSTFCESEMLVKDLETFTWLCINFSPASIEVLEPESIDVEAREITNWINDLLSKVHEIGTNYRSHKTANEHLTVAINQLIKNAILLSLRQGTRTLKDLETDTGILDEQLEPFLKHMAEKRQIIDLEGAYRLPDAAAKILPAQKAAPQIEAKTTPEPKKKKK
jgi:hypothetical protein